MALTVSDKSWIQSELKGIHSLCNAHINNECANVRVHRKELHKPLNVNRMVTLLCVVLGTTITVLTFVYIIWR